MDYVVSHVERLVLISLVVFGSLYSYVRAPSLWNAFSPIQPYDTDQSNMVLLHMNGSDFGSTSQYDGFSKKLRTGSQTTTISKDELETALEGASMSNRTLIIAVINRAYAEEKGMLDIFIESFRLGENTKFLLGHLLITAVDQTSFDRCNLVHLHCYKLVTDGVDFAGEKLYMSGDFIKMMWRRTIFLADVLIRGYNFIFTDTDVVWLRNPFLTLSHRGEDLQISCDNFNGHPFDIFNPINTGFYFVHSNNKTIALFDKWYTSRNESLPIKEQDVLFRMISTGVLGQLGMTVRFLDTRYFGGFCGSGRDFRQVVTMHANCCRTIKAKTEDLRVFLEEWKKFRGSNNATSTTGWPNHNACDDSWKVDPNQIIVK